MKHKLSSVFVLKPNASWGLYLTFVILLSPAIWYSLNTPFALIDDYNSWCILETFSSLSGILGWARDSFFHFGTGRFRPVFDLYNYITWSVFGDNYSLHHLMRLLLKALTAYFSIRMISVVTARKSNKFNLAVFAFLSIYLFFPNNPEARLAPQELTATFFLSILFYYISKLFVQNNGNIHEFSRTNYAALVLSFLCLSFSKEACLGLTGATLCFIIVLNATRKGFLRVLPFVITFAISSLIAFGLFRAGGYGTAPISYALIRNNFQWSLKYLLLYDTSKVFVVLLLLPIVFYLLVKAAEIRRRSKVHSVIPDRSSHSSRIKTRFLNMLLYDKELTLYTFLGLNYLAFFAVALTFWAPVLRYFYPLVYILSVLVGISFARIDTVSVHSRKVKVAATILCLYFVLGNYHNFMYQFAAQHSARINEDRMLTSVKQLLEKRETVYNVIQSEFEDKIGLYFNEYLPFFCDTDYRIQNVQRSHLFHKDIYYVTTNDVALPGHALKEKFINRHNLFLLRVAKSISSFVLCDKDPFYWIDAGTSMIGQQNWYIYENRLNLDDYRAGARVLYSSDRRIEVLSGEPYAESVVSLPEALGRNQVFVIKLRYHTVGDSNPHVTVIQIPYKPDNVPLHDRIPLSNSPRTIELPFSPSFDVPSPQILLRNWAPVGTLVIENIELSELAIDTDRNGQKQI